METVLRKHLAQLRKKSHKSSEMLTKLLDNLDNLDVLAEVTMDDASTSCNFKLCQVLEESCHALNDIVADAERVQQALNNVVDNIDSVTEA